TDAELGEGKDFLTLVGQLENLLGTEVPTEQCRDGVAFLYRSRFLLFNYLWFEGKFNLCIGSCG
ncbi:MAG: hypothetical protein OEL68_05170, partial [Desulfobulbaceae bacterium]|nr:hypothetical protein [Desulfobulbaceae bacterium]